MVSRRIIFERKAAKKKNYIFSEYGNKFHE